MYWSPKWTERKKHLKLNISKRIIKAYWWFVMFFCCRPYSLKQFKIFCLKFDRVTINEWLKMEEEILEDKTMRDLFKIKIKP